MRNTDARRRRLSGFVVTALLVAAGLAGCGDGADPSDGGQAADSQPSDEDGVSDVGAATDTDDAGIDVIDDGGDAVGATDASTVAVSVADATNDDGVASAISQDDCDVLWDLFHAPGGAQMAPADFLELLDSLPGRAPADVTEDLQALADVWRPALEMLDDLGVEAAEDVADLSADDLQRVEAAAEPFNGPDFAPVRARLEAFVDGGCQPA